jgi:phosphatidate cytidylyltransferase
MKTLIIRSLTGLLFATTIVGSIYLGQLTQAMVFGLFILIGLHEFFTHFSRIDNRVVFYSAIATGMLAYLFLILGSLNPVNFPFYSIIPVLFLVFSILHLWTDSAHPVHNISHLFFSFGYLIFPMFLFVHLNTMGTDGYKEVIALFILIWSNDSLAYLTGWLFGRTKLFERISPKKTWEGTIGGVIGAIIAGYLIGAFLIPNTVMYWIICALIVAPCAILGDLLESLFKRTVNIKDSGKILPGHGGVLDRFDAAIFAIPFYTLWASIYEVI